MNAQRALIRGRGNQIEEVETIPIIADGTSEQVRVAFDFEGEPTKTFIVEFFYRRWWVDAGGAFLFPHVDEERLKTEVQPSDGKVKVLEIEQKARAKPETGIVINLHPGNYPEFAIQFGLSTGEESELSYYLGPAVRLQEIGKRGLATFSFGAALTPTQRYPDVRVFDATLSATDGLYTASDARLLGTNEYELHWYEGISLGFNFGGVVAGADAVKEVP